MNPNEKNYNTMIELLPRMGTIVESYLKAYKSDFYIHDIDSMKKYHFDLSFWAIRKSGTDLLNIGILIEEYKRIVRGEEPLTDYFTPKGVQDIKDNKFSILDCSSFTYRLMQQPHNSRFFVIRGATVIEMTAADLRAMFIEIAQEIETFRAKRDIVDSLPKN